jgi:L-histidine N-alpha-methyltransferase
MCTEVSAKFRLPGLRSMLEEAGFTVVGGWADRDERMALTLATAV